MERDIIIDDVRAVVGGINLSRLWSANGSKLFLCVLYIETPHPQLKRGRLDQLLDSANPNKRGRSTLTAQG